MTHNIQHDDHAVRHGEPIAGYIVILAHPDGTLVGVDNKLFETRFAAKEHARTANPEWRITIKALRWAEAGRTPGPRRRRPKG